MASDLSLSNAGPRPIRWFEPNILSNPLTHFGIWTPRGWRVHAKRWGRARRRTLRLSGDGSTTVFPGVLRGDTSRGIGWTDDLHLRDDPFTDGGIYPADPRVEYPPGRPRWAVSHTLLCYPVADHGLYTHEYTWDLKSGDLRTHFRELVVERATTDERDGLTVRVPGPISCPIEGNECYPGLRCSAVRGVWDSSDRSGPNRYASRVVRVLPLANAVYGKIEDGPVVGVNGIYQVDTALEEGLPDDFQALGDRFQIPFDVPKLGMIRPPYRRMWSDCYQTEVALPGATHATVGEPFVKAIESRTGSRFVEGHVGFGERGAVGADAIGYAGYNPAFDLNSDGVIDDADALLARRHVGRRVALNHYLGAYFGGDWISTGCLLAPTHEPGIRVVADYVRGVGYDVATGTIRLHATPGPGKPVWVEYLRDVPAVAGDENLVVHVYDEA